MKTTIARTEKEQARAVTRAAVATGALTRPTICSRCGKRARVDAHHRDYHFPLLVEWLCRQCHATAHKRRLGYQQEMDVEEPMRVLSCEDCAYTWNPRVDTPTECPSCKSRTWRKGKPSKEVA